MGLYGRRVRHRRHVGIVTPVTAADSVAAILAKLETSMITITIIFGAVALASAIDWAIDRANRRRQSESWRNYRA